MSFMRYFSSNWSTASTPQMQMQMQMKAQDDLVVMQSPMDQSASSAVASSTDAAPMPIPLPSEARRRTMSTPVEITSVKSASVPPSPQMGMQGMQDGLSHSTSVMARGSLTRAANATANYRDIWLQP
mmetsp:Transcript_7780/g.13760  ORF Transcript_7780/g.13760 Transcript_7780/m.13760 type:complete len:127 (-) Transcript_7780:600-980(-)